jgi:hypothetical protein
MPSNNPPPVLAYPTIAEQRGHVHTTNPACHCGNIELAIANNPENIQFEHKYPRRAVRPAHLPVGQSMFREEMDAPMTNPVAHVRNDSAVAIRQPQREAPMLMREGAARGMQEEMSRIDRSCMAPVTAAMAPVTSAVSTLFSLAREAFHRAILQSSSKVLTPPQRPAQPEQIPVELEELYIPNHPGHYHRCVRSSPPQAPPPVAQLHRSNAIRRPHPPMPVGRRPARAHAVRRPTRDGILFPGATECVLGGLADSYYLPDAPRLQHALPPVNGWEEQRVVGGETLSIPLPTRRAVDKPLPPLPTNEPRQPLRSSHGPPRRPLPSHGIKQLPSLSTMPGLQDPIQRSNYLLWRNMNTNHTTYTSTNDSLSSGYETYATTDPDNVSDRILEAAPAGDRFSISDDDDAFSVGSSLHDDSDDDSDDEDANVPVAVPAQGRFVLSDSKEDSEGEAVGMALRVVNCGTHEQVEQIVRDQAPGNSSDESSTEGSTLTWSDTSPGEGSTVSLSQSSSADAYESSSSSSGESSSSDDDAPGGPEPAERRSPHDSSEDSWDTDDDFLDDTAQALTLHHQRRETQQPARNRRAAELEPLPVSRPASPSEEGSASDSEPGTLQGTPSASDSSDTLVDDEDDDIAVDLENWDLYAPPTASVQDVPGTPRPDSPVLPAPSQPSDTSSLIVNASSPQSIPLPSPLVLLSPPVYWDWSTAPTPATPPRSLSLAEPWLASPTILLLLDLQYENIRYSTSEEDAMAEFYRLADEENEEEEKWWDERSETMLSDTAFEEQANDSLLFADFDGYSSTSMLQPIPRRPRARGHQTRARNRDWESYIEPGSQADEERVADEVELPTADRLRAGFERVNEDASEEGQTTAGTFLLFYELRNGRFF